MLRNKKFFILINIYTSILLTWMNIHLNYVEFFGTSVSKSGKSNGLCRTNIRRSLSRNVFPRELTNMFSDNKINDKYGYGTNEIPTYMQFNNYQSNNLEEYKKDLKYKLAKNSGLKKWDCYSEEKIFDKIEEINKIKEKFNNDKRIMGKEIFKNHQVPILLCSLFLIFEIIIFFLSTIGSGYDPNGTEADLGKDGALVNEVSHLRNLLKNGPITWIIIVSSSILGVFIFSSCIYALLKFLKYKGIRRGMLKLKPKDYFSLLTK